jgi:hypothetical protein
VTSIKWNVRPPAGSKVVNTDQSTQFLYAPYKRKHQCEGMLGASDICAATYTQHLDTAGLACSDINIPKNRAVLVDHFQPRRQGEFFSPDAKGLGYDCFSQWKIAVQLLLGRYEPDIGGIERVCG